MTPVTRIPIRRILFVTVFVALGLLGFLGAVPAVAIGAAGAAVLTLFVIIAIPRIRTVCECTASGLFAASLLPVPAEIAPHAIIALSFVSGVLFYGRWTDIFGFRLSLSFTRCATFDQSPARVWARLVPAESHPEDFWNPALIDFANDPDDRETVYLRFRQSTGLIEEMTLSFIERTPFRHCHYLLEREAPNGQDDLELTLVIEPSTSKRCVVTQTIRQDRLPPRVALARWFDDAFAKEIDGLRGFRPAPQMQPATTMDGRLPVDA